LSFPRSDDCLWYNWRIFNGNFFCEHDALLQSCGHWWHIFFTHFPNTFHCVLSLPRLRISLKTTTIDVSISYWDYSSWAQFVGFFLHALMGQVFLVFM
jgi:hypothetical protein